MLLSNFADSYIYAKTESGGPFGNKFFIKLKANSGAKRKTVHKDILGTVTRMGSDKSELKKNTETIEDSILVNNQSNMENVDDSKMNIEDLKEKSNDKADIINSNDLIAMKIDQLEYYPNPNNGIFNVYFTITETCKTIITIFDVNGKEVYYEVINNYKGEYVRSLDLSGNGKGIYFLNIEQGDKTINKKLVIR